MLMKTRIERPTLDIECYFPRVPTMRGALHINLKSPAISSITNINFDHRRIVEELLPGYGGSERRFLPDFDAGNEAHHTQLGTVRVDLPSRTVEDLCSAIDELAPQYLQAHRDIEVRLWKSAAFPLASRRYVILGEMSRILWNEVLHYVEKKGGDFEDPVQTIADNHLSIVGPGLSPHTGFKAEIWPEPVPVSSREELRLLDNRVYLCWHVPQHEAPAQEEDFARGSCWDAERACEWLTGTLLPAIIDPEGDKSTWRSITSAVKALVGGTDGSGIERFFRRAASHVPVEEDEKAAAWWLARMQQFAGA